MSAELVELEQACPECKGKLGELYGGEWRNCAECAGNGLVPTAAGKRVLSLIRHNINLSVTPELVISG